MDKYIHSKPFLLKMFLKYLYNNIIIFISTNVQPPIY